jgi:SH3-like domain-containing protein
MAVTTQSFRVAVRRLSLAVPLAAVISVLHPTLAASPPANAASDKAASEKVANDAALTTGSVSGLPVPRFVSLKSDRVNVRSGPNKDQEVRWVYTKAGMPVEVTAEFENWRRIRDWEGSEGWVYHSLLSGKRTAVVVPKSKDELVPLYDSADPKSSLAAKLQAGVVGQIKSCDGKWCEFAGKNFDGFIEQERVWGAYPNEKVE